MKLNAQILYENIGETYSTQLSGTFSPELSLSRPVCCLGTEKRLVDNTVYLVHPEHVPSRPAVGKNVVIIAVGVHSADYDYLVQRCCVIQLLTRTAFFELINCVTAVYDRYDTWEEKLDEILHRNASIPEMAECSRPIFGNPIFVLNENFRFLAHTDYSGIAMAEWEKEVSRQSSPDTLDMQLLQKFMEMHELTTDSREPMLFRLLDSTTLSVNLFIQEEYRGCLTIDYRMREHRSSDEILAVFLAERLKLALKAYSISESNEKSGFRQSLKDLVDGYQIEPRQRALLSYVQTDRNYYCIRVKIDSRSNPVPTGYLCSLLENTFPGGIAFEHLGAILAFVRTDSGDENPESDAVEIRQKISSLFGSLPCTIGISNAFHDLFSVRLYYLQAVAAMANGRRFDPGRVCCCFRDYTFQELVLNSLGEMPPEMYFMPGMKRLAEHDREASVSYLETLKVFLDNNMSVVKTARCLYLNRSTLLERLNRIRRELDADLEDPDIRLQIQILLAAKSLQAKVIGIREE